MSRPGASWSETEINAAVDAYFRLHDDVREGRQVNKRAIYRELASRFAARTEKAFELKFQNISACLSAMGLPFVPGLVPMKNVQSALQELVAERVQSRANELSEWAERPEPRSMHEAPTPTFDTVPPLDDQPLAQRAAQVARHVDFAAMEARNRSLGAAGERWVLDFERQRLAAAGRGDLAKRVIHASHDEGDGLGYDIRSFDAGSARELLIEVKTTRGGPTMPFFLSARELLVSRARADAYTLYRVHSYGHRTRVYKLEGDLGERCQLVATQFRAVPRSA
jgi:hypothetical protein